MRWILVFLFLYLIPLIILFRNYKNLRRAYIYSSIYVVLVTMIVATNLYMSGLNKIREAIYYYSYVNDEPYEYKDNEDKEENMDKVHEVNKQDSEIYESKEEKSKEVSLEPKEIELEEDKEAEVIKKTDKEIVSDFKKEIYNIERKALIPMRDCMPYTKNISESIKKLPTIENDLKHASKKCKEVIEIYENMDIPSLSDEQYTMVLSNARDDVKKAYELREKAMNESINLVESKNPKYIGKITEYLNLSDEHIANFKERIDNLNLNIK